MFASSFITNPLPLPVPVYRPPQLQTDDLIIVDGDRVVAMGGMKEVDLSFEGLKLVLAKKGNEKVILDGSIRGRARPGRMLAILGPSGAGKSTVLHAIAGRIKDSSKLKLSGARYLNGLPLSPDSMVPSAFIEQDVMFFAHMTVRETLSFRVELKLGSLISKTARDAMVQDLLDELGLTRAADTVVGDSKVRGISGGERKRLSIAVEMIGTSSVVCNCVALRILDRSTRARVRVWWIREIPHLSFVFCYIICVSLAFSLLSR